MAGKPSEEYTAFDALMGRLLTVPKTVLKERMDAHRAKVDALPHHKRRGPKRGSKRPARKAR